MAGLGGFFGYAVGAINWNETILGNHSAVYKLRRMFFNYFLGTLLGGQVRAVFTLITILFLICVTYTITSFAEVPLYMLELNTETQSCTTENDITNNINIYDYGSTKIGEDISNVSKIVEYTLCT